MLRQIYASYETVVGQTFASRHARATKRGSASIAPEKDIQVTVDYSPAASSTPCKKVCLREQMTSPPPSCDADELQQISSLLQRSSLPEDYEEMEKDIKLAMSYEESCRIKRQALELKMRCAEKGIIKRMEKERGKLELEITKVRHEQEEERASFNDQREDLEEELERTKQELETQRVTMKKEIERLEQQVQDGQTLAMDLSPDTPGRSSPTSAHSPQLSEDSLSLSSDDDETCPKADLTVEVPCQKPDDSTAPKPSILEQLRSMELDRAVVLFPTLRGTEVYTLTTSQARKLDLKEPITDAKLLE